SVRAHLIDNLPMEQASLDERTEWLVLQAIELIEKTAQADGELVRYFITPDGEDHLPAWFVEAITKLWGDMLQVPKDMPAPSPFDRPTRFGSPSSPFSNTNRAPGPPPAPQRPRFTRPGKPQESDL